MPYEILLVEDDEAIALAIAAVLTKQNYVTDIAADGPSWLGICKL